MLCRKHTRIWIEIYLLHRYVYNRLNICAKYKTDYTIFYADDNKTYLYMVWFMEVEK